MIKLSIIVPVYNVEKYIRPCFESIFKQGLDDDDYEIIIINDGTKDHSMEMITDIINLHNNIFVINQENQGLSVARNNGISSAKGEYILMIDSDDILIDYSLKPLLEKALESKADLVVADFLVMNDKEINKHERIQQKNFSVIEKTGEQLFIEDHSPYHCFVWRTLYNRQFLLNERLKFYAGIRFQDIPFTYECYIKAKRCLRVSWLLIIYRQWPEASTASLTKDKAKNFCIAIAKTWELRTLPLSPAALYKLEESLWTHFTVFMSLICHHKYKNAQRFEIIDYLKDQIPDLSFNNGKKQKFYTFFYRYYPHTFIRLRFLYAKIIEDKLLPYYHKIMFLNRI